MTNVNHLVVGEEKVEFFAPVTDRSIEAVLSHEQKCWDFLVDIQMHGGDPLEDDVSRWREAHNLVRAVIDYLGAAKMSSLEHTPIILPKAKPDDGG